MEQQLINAFMKFTAKAGAGTFVKDLVQQTDENGNPKDWTKTEMQRAIEFLNEHTEVFGKSDAITIVQTLMKKFDISANDLESNGDAEQIPATTGVKGLQ